MPPLSCALIKPVGTTPVSLYFQLACIEILVSSTGKLKKDNDRDSNEGTCLNDQLLGKIWYAVSFRPLLHVFEMFVHSRQGGPRHGSWSADIVAIYEYELLNWHADLGTS